LQEQLAEESLQIDAERSRVIARTRSLYAASRDREQLMMKERQQIIGNMVDKSSELTSFRILKDEAIANASLYNTLQGRLREAGIYAGLRSSNIRVVDMASNLHKPSGPHRSFIIGLGSVAACLFAVVLSFVRESLRNTVLTPDDVKIWTGLPSLALLPAIHRLSEADPPGSRAFSLTSKKQPCSIDDVRLMKSGSAESEAIRELRTSLLGSRNSAPRVILVSSSMEGEGKTTVAVNFAIALAQVGRTCLVDGDLRHPCVATAFGIDARAPLTEVISGKFPLGSALIRSETVSNLSILPCGTVSGSPADVLSSEQMTTMLDVLRSEFTFVVIDSPPVIRFSDARFLSSVSDEVIIVGRYGLTTRRAIQRTAEILNEMRASVAGVVLNGIDFSSPDYEYYTYGYTSAKNKREYRTQGVSAESTPNDKPGAMGAHA
jgi:polysaccharide biosynthesis transport protein